MGFALKRPDDAAGSAVPAIVIGLFVSFGGVLFGYDTGTISGILAMKFWREMFSTGYVDPNDGLPGVTSSQSSMIVSLLSAGTFFGALGAAPLADTFGRRLAMIINSFVFCVGVTLQTASTAIPLFGRWAVLCWSGFPLYQSETAPKWIRDVIVGAYQLAITFGLLLASIVNNATKDRNDTGCYRIPVAVQFAWAIILVAGMIVLPETPRFFIKKGKHYEAAKSLARLRRLDVNDISIIEELAEIQAHHESELRMGDANYLEIMRGSIGKRLATGCAIQALQQLAGINFILYYGTTFFQNSGIQNSFIISLITSIINLISTLPGMYLTDKTGRRPLLLFGAVGMCVSQLIVAIVGTVTTSTISNQVLIAFVCVYIFFFASSWGPIAWVVTGELFPLKARAKCISITTATCWLFNCVIAYATPYMVNSGPRNANLQSKVFFIWGGFCFLCAIFVYTCIYETKGLSLEQIDELYSKVSVAWKSPGFVSSANHVDVLDVVDSELDSHAQLELQANEKWDGQTATHMENIYAKADF
ncbi:Major facilitator-type transporter ecdD [Penicillium waksmanii]|uniref:Major facilitator-type transporter ecdD n=1 Tax=Penicillium waksmanii TaxID=69791 RepID=UPI002546BA3B|nr:Major facilitator-type transporter ecdD [Penicillium waksmanii]KAJ5982903.1 Major facilitator-type transporter ecdD [Penicillium waksmanii]